MEPRARPFRQQLLALCYLSVRPSSTHQRVSSNRRLHARPSQWERSRNGELFRKVRLAGCRCNLSLMSTNSPHLREVDRRCRTQLSPSFAPTAGAGTSYAAPAVAHLAAIVADQYPNNSANLVRALLAASATVPEAAEERLAPLAEDAVLRVWDTGPRTGA